MSYFRYFMSWVKVYALFALGLFFILSVFYYAKSDLSRTLLVILAFISWGIAIYYNNKIKATSKYYHKPPPKEKDSHVHVHVHQEDKKPSRGGLLTGFEPSGMEDAARRASRYRRKRKRR